MGAALAGLLWAAPAVAIAAQQIRHSSIAVAPGYTRIELETERSFRYALHAAGDHARILLELADVEPGQPLHELETKLGPQNPYLTAIQVHPSGAHAVVLEFDLRGRVQARAVALPPDTGRGYRLVLDLYPASAATRGSADADADGNAAAGEETWLAVQVNRQRPMTTALFLMTPDHQLSASRADLERWRLRVPPGAVFRYQGQEYVPLSAFPSLSSRLDLTTLTLDLLAPAPLFTQTDINVRHVIAAPAMPTTLGGFFNYDVVAERSESGTHTAETHFNGLFEVGTYDGFGVITTSFVRRDLGSQADTVRLDSTWTLDHPEKLASLRVGDAITRAAAWGGAVRFGGLQWSTNFATQPGFFTMPLPGLSGEATLPSTVDLYINDIRRLHQDVVPGPFTLQETPMVSGQGEARLVVRDILGREQIVTQPFYSSPRLLRAGLQDYSYEVGAVRENYGLASNDYGRFLAVGTHRLGFTDRLTGEAHAEVLNEQQTGGLGVVTLLPALGVLSGAIAGSHSDAGSGELLALGLERQGRILSLGLSSQLASADFTYLGLQPGQPAPRQISRAYGSVSSHRHGSFALSYTLEDRRGQATVELVNANYSVNVLHDAYLSLFALWSLGGDSDTTVGLTFTKPLGNRSSYSASVSGNAGNTQGYMQLQRNLPAGPGVGYRLRASMSDDTDNEQASITAQNNIGTYTLEAARYDDQDGLRAGASGGLVLVRDGIFLSRRISDSFAVVHVADIPNVRIYADNQLVARTDAHGDALVPRLRAYQKNPIRIDAADLPLDAQVSRVTFDAVPPFRSGLLLEFPVHRARGATLTVLLDDGRPMPAGAVARLDSDPAAFPIGEKGLLYLTGLAASNHLTVSWHGQSCTLELAFPAGDDPLPDLGAHTCAGVLP